MKIIEEPRYLKLNNPIDASSTAIVFDNSDVRVSLLLQNYVIKLDPRNELGFHTKSDDSKVWEGN